MWEPFKGSIEQWAPDCAIVYDNFHIMQNANKAIDEVRRAEFFRKGGTWRGVVKGKRWLPRNDDFLQLGMIIFMARNPHSTVSGKICWRAGCHLNSIVFQGRSTALQSP